jgi:hypothetical protein
MNKLHIFVRFKDKLYLEGTDGFKSNTHLMIVKLINLTINLYLM